jgi:hypothetical protein
VAKVQLEETNNDLPANFHLRTNKKIKQDVRLRTGDMSPHADFQPLETEYSWQLRACFKLTISEEEQLSFSKYLSNIASSELV